MKYLTGGAILAILVGMAITTRVSNTTEYEPILEDVKEEEVVPTIPVEWLEEAEEAKRRVLERKQLEAEREVLQTKIKEREDYLKAEKEKVESEIEELDRQIQYIEKQLGF